MFQNKYIFGGCKVCLKSRKPIKNELEFSRFFADFTKADYSLSIIETDILPTPCGEIALQGERQTLYKGEKDLLYTRFYDCKNGLSDFGVCKEDEEKLYISLKDGLREMVIFDSINLPSMLLKKGIGLVHSSFIEYNGEAILFVGDKQVGKSTQAFLWQKYRNAKIINGDRAAVYLENGKFYADGIPFCGTSKICENKKLPIRAIICPQKFEENKIEKLTPITAFMEILGKFTYNNLPQYTEKITDLVKGICESVPIYRFACKKDESAVDFLYNELFLK